jgi:hypothetical protein
MARGQDRDRVKERRWRRLVKDWRRSGLSVRAFCEWHALSEPSFYAWRRELAKRDREAASNRARRSGRPGRPRILAAPFLPVQVVADVAQDSEAGRCVEVQLPSGVCLRVPAGFDRQTLRDVLAAVEGPEGAPRC